MLSHFGIQRKKYNIRLIYPPWITWNALGYAIRQHLFHHVALPCGIDILVSQTLQSASAGNTMVKVKHFMKHKWVMARYPSITPMGEGE